MKLTGTISLIVLALCGSVAERVAVAPDAVALDAAALFERSVARDVVLRDSAIELADGVLVEDVGPAAGYSYKPNEERLSETVWARKDLVVADPRCRSATLLLAPGGEGL